ncbi:MAG: helix-turn-helix transcriptional regulator [Clostridiales bacterium]|nr:helix-turn-helix transcriptional regulator [Clostridiales bacterium]
MVKMLRELRKQKGITMKQLGEIVGVAESTVSQYETGKRDPDYETLLAFAGYFGVSADYLLLGEDKNSGQSEVSDADIKFALFGDREIDDEVYEEVKAFAQFAKERKKNGKAEGTV